MSLSADLLMFFICLYGVLGVRDERRRRRQIRRYRPPGW